MSLIFMFCFSIQVPQVFQKLAKNLLGWGLEFARTLDRVVTKLFLNFQKEKGLVNI